MPQNRSKAELWDAWVEQTVLPDIQTAQTPDPIEMIDDAGDALAMTEEYDSYRLGRGSGDYLYLLYLLDGPGKTPSNVIPVYIGETGNVASRLMDHFRKVRDALPLSEWEDDGSWGATGNTTTSRRCTSEPIHHSMSGSSTSRRSTPTRMAIQPIVKNSRRRPSASFTHTRDSIASSPTGISCRIEFPTKWGRWDPTGSISRTLRRGTGGAQSSRGPPRGGVR